MNSQNKMFFISNPEGKKKGVASFIETHSKQEIKPFRKRGLL